MDTVSHKDILDDLFGQIPEEPLPAGFRNNLMEQIRMEAVRAVKRKERRGLISIIAASVAIIAVAIGTLYKYGMLRAGMWLKPEATLFPDIPAIDFPSLSNYSFSLFIGVLALILLALDYYLRKIFRERRQKTAPNEL